MNTSAAELILNCGVKTPNDSFLVGRSLSPKEKTGKFG